MARQGLSRTCVLTAALALALALAGCAEGVGPAYYAPTPIVVDRAYGHDEHGCCCGCDYFHHDGGFGGYGHDGRGGGHGHDGGGGGHHHHDGH